MRYLPTTLPAFGYKVVRRSDLVTHTLLAGLREDAVVENDHHRLHFDTETGGIISWRTPEQPLPMEGNPRKVFYSMFGQGDTESERQAMIRTAASLPRTAPAPSSTIRCPSKTAR